MHFDLVATVLVLSNGVEDTPLRKFFCSCLYLLYFIISRIAWIDKLHYCVKRIFVFLTMIVTKTKKRPFFSYSNSCKEEKFFVKTMDLIDSNYHWKNWVEWKSNTSWEKILQSQEYTSLEKGPKVKYIMFTFHGYFPQFCF